jgi:protein TonB
MTSVAPLLESQWSRIGRWVVAALVGCGLHAGGLVLALMHQPEEAWDDPASGVNVDLIAPPAPMPVKSEDVAHGPEQPYGKEAAEAQKQVVQKVEKDDPLVEPSPALNPEVVLPKPRPDQKEQLQEEAQDAAEKREAQDEGQEVKTAPPRVEAQPAPASAKSEGSSSTIARAQAGWMKGLVRELERNKRIPESARRRRGEWRTVVEFTLDRAGKVVSSKIRQSSGVPALDDEALALLKRVTFPPAPGELPGETFEYTLPITAKVN